MTCRALPALLLLAFSFRAWAVLAVSDPVNPSGDLQYHFYAVSLLEAGEYRIATPDWSGEAVGIFQVETLRSFKPPLYPLFLAGIYALLGRAFLWVGLVQALLGSLTCWVAYRLGARLFGCRAGLLACALLAVYPYYVFHGTSVGDTALYTLLLGAVILALYRFSERPALARLLPPALLLSLTILCRPTSLALLPVVGLWLLLGTSLPRPLAARALLFLLLLTALSVAPWALRNTLLHGRLVLVGTNGGYTFWQANNPFTEKYLRLRTDLDAITFREAAEWRERSPTGLAEAEQDSWFYREGLRFIRERPGEVLRLLWLKLGGFWGLRLYPGTESWVKGLLYSRTYSPLLGLAALGALRIRGRGVGLLLGLFAAFSVVYALFYGMTRYRSPLDQFLAVLAGSMLEVLWVRVSGRGERAERISSASETPRGPGGGS